MSNICDCQSHISTRKFFFYFLFLFKFNNFRCVCETPPHQLFVDKDTLVGALNAAHDLHMLAIDSKEDRIASRVRKDLAALLKSLQEEELNRSRKRVVEIEQYVQQQKEEVEPLASS